MSYLVKSESALLYECGYSCDNGLFLRLGSDGYFVTDGRYTIEAKESIKDSSVEIVENRDIFKSASEILRKNRVKSITIDPKNFTIFEFEKLTKKLRLNFKKTPNFEQNLRIKKTQNELEILKSAMTLNSEAFLRFLDFCKSDGMGKSEKELHKRAKEILENGGRYELSFNPIVGINADAAKAHALPSDELFLKEDDLLLFDAGIKYQGYCADRTRTAQVSRAATFEKNQTFKDTKKQKIYDIVLKAQEAAIAGVRAGMKACELDAIARDIIDKEGFGKYFNHSLGHGIGLDIHEQPVISKSSKTVLEDGMVFSIEPGIYLEGEFGVRIEDIVVIKEGRAEIL